MASVVVVKCGGHGSVDHDAVCRDIAEAVRAGRRVALVHGGSDQIDQLAARMGVPQRTQVAPDGVTARHTDAATLEVVTLALAGMVKPALVAALSRYGVAGVGLTGLDGGLLRARLKPPQRAIVDGRRVLVRDNCAGTVYRVNADLLRLLLCRGMVPVVSPPALADGGQPVNVNADRAAAAVAAALQADVLLFLTGAPGVQSDPSNEDSVLARCVLPRSGPPPAGAVGGMALKLMAAREALLTGVRQVRVSDGRCEVPIQAALAGGGTVVVLDRNRADGLVVG